MTTDMIRPSHLIIGLLALLGLALLIGLTVVATAAHPLSWQVVTPLIISPYH